MRILLLASSIVLTACVTSAPLATTADAVKALKNGNLKDFRGQLTVEARQAIGKNEMDEIRQKLAQYSNIVVEQPLLISGVLGDRGGGDIGDVERTYATVIAGVPRKGAPLEAIYTVVLKCELSNQLFHADEVAETCTTNVDDNGTIWTSCYGGSPAYDYVELVESCGIDRIEE